MKKRTYKLTLISAAILLVLASCAEHIYESIYDTQQRILDAWVDHNYGEDLQPTESGMYYLNRESSPNGRPVVDSVYVFVKYSVKYLDGVYKDSNIEEIAQQLGTYSPTNYYTHDIWLVNEYSLTEGLYEVLTSMKTGEKVTVAIPPSLLFSETISYYSMFYYTTEGNDSEKVSVIYELEVLDFVPNINEYQLKQLREFRDQNYPGLESSETGFFFKKTKSVSFEESADSIADEESLKIFYTGRLLDGFVFDSNIKDTAKKYRFYTPSNGYNALEVKYKDSLSLMLENNELVEGFTRAVHQMQYGEEAIVFFYSNLGYGERGSGTIPSYTPLFFELRAEEEEEN